MHLDFQHDFVHSAKTVRVDSRLCGMGSWACGCMGVWALQGILA